MESLHPSLDWQLVAQQQVEEPAIGEEEGAAAPESRAGAAEEVVKDLDGEVRLDLGRGKAVASVAPVGGLDVAAEEEAPVLGMPLAPRMG